jgi:metal-responsive CopG/Arc/MetJ family transcriptional regulator
MKKKKEAKTIGIWIDQGLLLRLDQIAEKAGVSRNQLMTNLIEVGLEEAEAFDKLGLYRLARLIEQSRERIKARMLGQAMA